MTEDTPIHIIKKSSLSSKSTLSPARQCMFLNPTAGTKIPPSTWAGRVPTPVPVVTQGMSANVAHPSCPALSPLSGHGYFFGQSLRRFAPGRALQGAGGRAPEGPASGQPRGPGGLWAGPGAVAPPRTQAVSAREGPAAASPVRELGSPQGMQPPRASSGGSPLPPRCLAAGCAPLVGQFRMAGASPPCEVCQVEALLQEARAPGKGE